MSTFFWVVLGVLAVIILWFVGGYNRFIRLIIRTKEAWADIEVQLKRRYDLIPNLVNTVKGYATHEQGTFEAVISARAKATQMTVDPSNITPDQIKAFGASQMDLSQALGRLLALSENYPDLKANQNFIELQKELSDTENKIQAARRFYNGNVRDLNIGIDSFPNNIIANMFKFKKMEFFELEAGSNEKAVPEVKFN